ncbi:type IV secretion protein Rhs [Buttiauxella selenatireducens]|uniref:Type IV secretion protein Rhs n=1 Tax=Buttiauxella selenatireducens TaxID=3073902 RepID=A0ABY9S6H3_9ENTR|nr:type IV secretion protein Rhs [Buttiauxella sp. R73]WMY72635.1 type IV secretion protein Rhs [Buttiauxella sp. R73]
MYENPVKYAPLKKGGLRLLTPGEIGLACSLFDFSVHYNQVWVHRGGYLPFNLQDNYTAMTPDGEMWFQDGVYQNDFSIPYVDGQHLFLHEMMHVYQKQRGMWVKTRGAFSWAADYTYSLDKATLSDYSMEQQACIVSDYWLLKHHGFFGHTNLYKFRDYDPHEPVRNLLVRYVEILGNFP